MERKKLLFWDPYGLWSTAILGLIWKVLYGREKCRTWAPWSPIGIEIDLHSFSLRESLCSLREFPIKKRQECLSFLWMVPFLFKVFWIKKNTGKNQSALNRNFPRGKVCHHTIKSRKAVALTAPVRFLKCEAFESLISWLLNVIKRKWTGSCWLKSCRRKFSSCL